MKKKITFTKGEELYLHRTGLRLNQAKMAKKLKVSRSKYARWEHDELEDIPVFTYGTPRVHFCAIPYFVCLILRRRSKKTQADIAEELGCCRYWVNRMENGKAPIEPLLKYWGI